MHPLEITMLVAAAVGAGALTLPEALAVRHLPGGFARGLWLRRTLTRTVALGSLGWGALALSAATAGVVWHDCQAFLQLRPLAQEPSLSEWLWIAARLALGIALSGLTLPPIVAATLGGFVAFGALSAWAVTVSMLPLPHGRGSQLLVVCLAVAAPALMMGGWSARVHERGEPRADDARALAPLRRVLVVCATALLGVGWVMASDRLRWPPLAPLIGVGLLALLVKTGRLGRGPRWTGALMEQRRPAWLLLAGLLCVSHATVLLTVTPVVAERGQATLARLATWPQLLTGVPDPRAEQWEQVAGRIRERVERYRGTRWCGQWLLILAWIEQTRLNHHYSARLLLIEARDHYGRAWAVAPPGFATGRRVGTIADRVLEEWGPMVDPGAHPS